MYVINQSHLFFSKALKSSSPESSLASVLLQESKESQTTKHEHTDLFYILTSLQFKKRGKTASVTLKYSNLLKTDSYLINNFVKEQNIKCVDANDTCSEGIIIYKTYGMDEHYCSKVLGFFLLNRNIFFFMYFYLIIVLY